MNKAGRAVKYFTKQNISQSSRSADHIPERDWMGTEVNTHAQRYRVSAFGRVRMVKSPIRSPVTALFQRSVVFDNFSGDVVLSESVQTEWTSEFRLNSTYVGKQPRNLEKRRFDYIFSH